MDEHAHLCKTFLGKDLFYLQKTMPVIHSQVLGLHGATFPAAFAAPSRNRE